MVLTPWDERKRTTDQLQPLIQNQLSEITGGLIAVFQPPPLPGSRGLPIQFVIQSTEDYFKIYEVINDLMDKIRASGMFIYLDTDLKIDKSQTTILLNRDKASELGLTMSDIGNVLSSNLSQNYVNYFNLYGRSYQVIPQVVRSERLNNNQLLNYYITTANGSSCHCLQLQALKIPRFLNPLIIFNSLTLPLYQVLHFLA